MLKKNWIFPGNLAKFSKKREILPRKLNFFIQIFGNFREKKRRNRKNFEFLPEIWQNCWKINWTFPGKFGKIFEKKNGNFAKNLFAIFGKNFARKLQFFSQKFCQKFAIFQSKILQEICNFSFSVVYMTSRPWENMWIFFKTISVDFSEEKFFKLDQYAPMATFFNEEKFLFLFFFVSTNIATRSWLVLKNGKYLKKHNNVMCKFLFCFFLLWKE